MKSKAPAGEHFMIVFLRTMSSTCDLMITQVLEQISLYLRSKFDIDMLPSHLSLHLPRLVPLPTRYAMIDLFFICSILDGYMEAFIDDHKILRLRVISTVPTPTLSSIGESCLS